MGNMPNPNFGEFRFSATYPNPFNPTTSIRFAIPSTSNVKLIVYDLLGNEIVTLIDGRMAAGTYNVTLDASNLLAGRL